MILNENSWHARLYKKIKSEDLPNNLCSYFWNFIGMILIFIFLLTASIIILLSLFGYFFGMIPGKSGLIVTCIMWSIVAIGIIVMIKDGIVYEYVAAKINKICPKIQWVKKTTKSTKS